MPSHIHLPPAMFLVKDSVSHPVNVHNLIAYPRFTAIPAIVKLTYVKPAASGGAGPGTSIFTSPSPPHKPTSNQFSIHNSAFSIILSPMILAGIDEAGYGPLLGPLVVSCAAFEVPDFSQPAPLPLTVPELPCLWKLLSQAVLKKNTARSQGRLLIADSKVVHNLSNGDRLLERGVLAFLPPSPTASENQDTTLDLAQLVARFGCSDHGLGDHPWYEHPKSPIALPYWCDAGDLRLARTMVRAAGLKAGVRLKCLRSALVCEKRFNEMLGRTNNKATALISITLYHLYYLHEHFGHLGLVVGVDKQGGRDHYTQLLLSTFPEASLKVLCEDDGGSSYQLTESHSATPHVPESSDNDPSGGGRGRQTIIHFRAKGETHFMATALASMTCKYLRELCMTQFNAWWGARIPGLVPTAGYYQDGTRWLEDVTPHLERLGVTRADLVRVK